jgi:hypothetical protein
VMDFGYLSEKTIGQVYVMCPRTYKLPVNQ